MYRELTQSVKVNGEELRNVESIHINKSIDKLIDTGEVRVIGQRYGYQTGIEKKVFRGDKIEIKMGYDGSGNSEFTGYVKSVTTDNSVTISCEDSMTLLKKSVQPRAFTNATVKDIVDYVVAETKSGHSVASLHDAGSVKFVTFQIGESDGFGVIEKLQKETGLHFYARGMKLVIDIAYLGELNKQNRYDFSGLKNAVIKSSLKYRRKGERLVQVEVVGLSKKGTRKVAKAGEEGGDKITIYKYDVDFGSLDKIAISELSKYETEGYEGHIEVLLEPYCTYGYGIYLQDDQYPERTRHSYFAESVEVGMNERLGGYRKIRLGRRIS